MRLLLIFSIIIIVSFTVLPSHALPTAGTQLFYDGFASSELSPYWNVVPLFGTVAPAGISQLGNVSQGGNFLTLTDQRASFAQTPNNNPISTSIMATGTDPIVKGASITVPGTAPSLVPFSTGNDTCNNCGQTTDSPTFSPSIAGDYLFMLITTSTTATGSPTVTSVSGGGADNGWSLRTSIFGNTNNLRQYEYSAIAKNGIDVPTVNFNTACNYQSCTETNMQFIVRGVTSFDAGGPVSATGSGTSSSTAITTSTTNPSFVIGFGAIWNGPTVISYGSGYTGFNSWLGNAGEYKRFSGGTTAVTFSYGMSVSFNNIADALDGTPNTTSNQNGSTGFFFMSWRIQAFNLTQVGNGSPQNRAIRNGALIFGLFQQRGSFSGVQGPLSLDNGIGFNIVETDSVSNNPLMNLGGAREAIALWFGNPMYSGSNGGANCFAASQILTLPAGCSSYSSPILYSGTTGTIDVNAPHTYTMEANLETNGTSWAAFQVDNNAWVNVTQTACSCIEIANSQYSALYPYIASSYWTTISTTNPFPSPSPGAVVPSQSLGTLVNWVLVDDYVPASLPAGNIIPSNGVPPPSLGPLGGAGGLSLTQFLQFEANSISPGNLYAGGMLLTIIVSGTVFAVLFGLSRRFDISVKNYGLFFTMFVLVLSFLFFTASILPIWIPAMMTIITMGIVFGVIKTGNASGGLVPD